MMGIRRLCRFWVRLIFLPFFYCGILLAFFLFGCILCAFNLITTFRPLFGLLHLLSPAKKYPVHLSIASSAAAPLHAEKEEEEDEDEDITALCSSNRDDDRKLGLDLAATESLLSDGSSVAQRVDMQKEEEKEEKEEDDEDGIESLCSSNRDDDRKCGLDLAAMESFRSDGSSISQRVDMQEEEEEEEGITSLCSSNHDGEAAMESLRFDRSSAAQRVDMPLPEEADPPSLVMASSTALLHEEEEEEENIALCSSNGNEDRRCRLDLAMTESLSSDSNSFAQRVEKGPPQEDDPSPPVMASSTIPLHPEKVEQDRALCSSNGDEDCKDGLDSALTESISSDSSLSAQIADISPPDEDDSSAEVTSSSTTPLLAEEEIDIALCSSNGNEDCKDGLDLSMTESLSSDSSSSAQIENMSPPDEDDPSAAVMSSSTASLLAEEVDRALCSSNGDEECKDGLDLVMTESLSSDSSSFAQRVEMGPHQKDDLLPAVTASSTTPLLAEEEDRALCSFNVDEDRKDGLDSAMAESLSSDISSISQRVDMLPREEDDAPPPVLASSTTPFYAEEEYRAICSSNDDEDRKHGLDLAMTERLSSDSSSFGQRIDMVPPEEDDPLPAVMASSTTPLHAEKEDEGLEEEDRALCSSNGDEDRKDGLNSAMMESLSSDSISFAQGVEMAPPQEYDPPHAVMTSSTIPLHAEEEEEEEEEGEGSSLCCCNGNGDCKDGLDSAMMGSLSSDSTFFDQKVEITPPQEDESLSLVMASSTTPLHTEAVAEKEDTVLCSSNGDKDRKDWLNLATTESLRADSSSFAQRVDMVPPQKDDPPSAIMASSTISLDAEEEDEDDRVFCKSNDDEDRKDGFDSVMAERLSSDGSSFTQRVDMLPLEEDDPPPVKVLASVEDHSSSSSPNCLTGNESLIKLESRSLKTDESFNDVAMTRTASIGEHSSAELLQNKADFKTGNVFMPETSGVNSATPNEIKLESGIVKTGEGLDDAAMALEASIEETLPAELLQSEADIKTGNMIMTESSDENSVTHNGIKIESGIMNTDEAIAESFDYAAMAVRDSIEEASSAELLQSKSDSEIGNMSMTESSSENSVVHNGIEIESRIIKTDEAVAESFDDAAMALKDSIEEPSSTELPQSNAASEIGNMSMTESSSENFISQNGSKIASGIMEFDEAIAEIFDDAAMAQRNSIEEALSAELPQTEADLKTGNMIMTESSGENSVTHSGIKLESGILKTDKTIAECFNDASMTPRTLIEESLSAELLESKADFEIGNMITTESSYGNSITHNGIELESGIMKMDEATAESFKDEVMEPRASIKEISSAELLQSEADFKIGNVFMTESFGENSVAHSVMKLESGIIKNDETIAESFEDAAMTVRDSIVESSSAELPQSEADFKIGFMSMTESSDENSIPKNIIKLQSALLEEDARVTESPIDPSVKISASTEDISPSSSKHSTKHSSGSIRTSTPNLEKENITKISNEPVNMPDFRRISKNNAAMTESSCKDSVTLKALKVESGLTEEDNITKISKDPEGIKDSTEKHHSKGSEIQPLDSTVESGFIEDTSLRLIRISSSPHTQTEGIFSGLIDQQAQPAIELSRADSESLELTVMHSDSAPSNESKEGNDRSFGFNASQNTPSFNSNSESDSVMEQFGILGQLHPNTVPIGGIQIDNYTSDWSLLVPDEAEASVVIDTDKKPAKNSGIDEDDLLEKVCESETSLDQDENARKEELLILNDIEIIKTILGCNIKSDASLTQQIKTLSRFIGVEPIPPMQNMGALEIAIQELNLLKFIIGIK